MIKSDQIRTTTSSTYNCICTVQSYRQYNIRMYPLNCQKIILFCAFDHICVIAWGDPNYFKLHEFYKISIFCLLKFFINTLIEEWALSKDWEVWTDSFESWVWSSKLFLQFSVEFKIFQLLYLLTKSFTVTQGLSEHSSNYYSHFYDVLCNFLTGLSSRIKSDPKEFWKHCQYCQDFW